MITRQSLNSCVLGNNFASSPFTNIIVVSTPMFSGSENPIMIK